MLLRSSTDSTFNIEHSTLNIQHFSSRIAIAAAALIASAIALPAITDDLSVDRRTVRVDEPVSIVVSLEGAFAVNDALSLPVKNLAIDGPPSVSSEFSWINGAVTRRKVFRFTARPLRPGGALVGPLVVRGEGGQRETLPAIAVEIVADRASDTNDPLTILHELLATSREPLFVVAEADKSSVWAGEEVVVTWYLYNGASVERWQIGAAPKLEDFWTEEIDVQREEPERVFVGTMTLQKMAIRRVALFPLHSGQLRISGMEVNAQVMRRFDSGPASLFEGSLVETGFDSAPLMIEARPLPPGPPPDVIGQVSLDCSTPAQKPGGPVAMTVTMRGRANLRGVEPPRLDGAVDGEVQIQPSPLSVQRTAAGVTMLRKWQYLIFPARSGRMTVPSVVTTAFDTTAARTGLLRCGGAALVVNEVAPPAAPGGKAAPSRRSNRDLLPWIAAIVIALLAAIVFARRLRSWLRLRREVRALAGDAPPAAVRDRVHAWLHERGIDVNALAIEPSDRGDAYRAFRSLVDARDRIDDAGDLELRVRELVQAVR
jgi:BatD DUF11 like domain